MAGGDPLHLQSVGVTGLSRTDHVSDRGRWTLFRKRPGAPLAGYVHEIQGYVEEGGDVIVRKEIPSTAIALILVFGDGFTLHEDDTRPRNLARSFVGGLHERAVLVGSRGRALCMQVDLTPIGAWCLFRHDMHDLTGHVVNLDDLMGAFAGQLEEQLADARGWAERFAIVERMLLTRIATAAPNTLALAGWNRMAASAGNIRIGRLARDLDCSPRHLIATFRRYIGLPPKALARIVRFENAVSDIDAARHTSLASLAAARGYADQAHLNREFRDLAGETPLQLHRRTLPDGTGIMADLR